MGMMVQIAAHDGAGSFNVYRAEPDAKPKGAVIVIQEIFGLNPGIRARVDRWAQEGYLAYAPDLFWRDTPGLDLDPDIPEQFQAALGHMGKFDRDKGILDIETLIRHARVESGGKVGVIGYCLGGLMTYLSATRTDCDASVAYYGGGIDSFLNESHAIARPLMLHFAQQDHFIPPEAVATIRAAFDDNPRVLIHEYPDVDHGFATESGKRRVEHAARLADERSLAFFAEHLA